jgi:hypothetical protein
MTIKTGFFLVLLLSYFFVSYLSLNILLFVIWTSSSSYQLASSPFFFFLFVFTLDCPHSLVQRERVCCVFFWDLCAMSTFIYRFHFFFFFSLTFVQNHPSHSLNFSAFVYLPKKRERERKLLRTMDAALMFVN